MSKLLFLRVSDYANEHTGSTGWSKRAFFFFFCHVFLFWKCAIEMSVFCNFGIFFFLYSHNVLYSRPAVRLSMFNMPFRAVACEAPPPHLPAYHCNGVRSLTHSADRIKGPRHAQNSSTEDWTSGSRDGGWSLTWELTFHLWALFVCFFLWLCFFLFFLS